MFSFTGAIPRVHRRQTLLLLSVPIRQARPATNNNTDSSRVCLATTYIQPIRWRLGVLVGNTFPAGQKWRQRSRQHAPSHTPLQPHVPDRSPALQPTARPVPQDVRGAQPALLPMLGAVQQQPDGQRQIFQSDKLHAIITARVGEEALF